MHAVRTMVGRVLRTTTLVQSLWLAPAAALLLASSPARAQEPPPPPESSEETPAPARPLPRNDRSGRVSAYAGLQVVVPAGDLGAGTKPLTKTSSAGITLAQVAGTGIGGEAGLAVGLSWYSALDLRGQFVQFEPGPDCVAARGAAVTRALANGQTESGIPSCSAQMFAVGLGLTYHTAQALGFDPWVRFGTGYRAMTIRGPLTDISATAPASGTFHGVDVVDLTLGGDYFPAPWFGLGLYMTGVVGVDVSAPSAEAKGAVYGFFQAGIRIALEPQRRAVTAASGSSGSGTALVEHSVFGPSLYNRAAR